MNSVVLFENQPASHELLSNYPLPLSNSNPNIIEWLNQYNQLGTSSERIQALLNSSSSNILLNNSLSSAAGTTSSSTTSSTSGSTTSSTSASTTSSSTTTTTNGTSSSSTGITLPSLSDSTVALDNEMRLLMEDSANIQLLQQQHMNTLYLASIAHMNNNNNNSNNSNNNTSSNNNPTTTKFDFVIENSPNTNNEEPSPTPARKNIKVHHQQPFNPSASPSLFNKLKREENNGNGSFPSNGNHSHAKKDDETIRRQRDMFIQQHQRAKAFQQRETRSSSKKVIDEEPRSSPISSLEPSPNSSKNEILNNGNNNHNNNNSAIDNSHLMEQFNEEKVCDFKHVIYNLLVAYQNDPNNGHRHFVIPLQFKEGGQIRHGFKFNEALEPEKRLPELYAQHIRKASLEKEDQDSIFIQDLYKFYLRASVELLSKYFEKRDKYTYLYEDIPLFVAGSTLEQAEERIRNMKTRARKMKKRKNSS